MVVVSTGATDAERERLMQWLPQRESAAAIRPPPTSENIDADEELVSSQKDVPGTHRTVLH